jgi:septin 7
LTTTPLNHDFVNSFKVNIIPLVAKADTLTPDECQEFKKEILREIQLHNINIYEFPDAIDEEENR